MKKYICLFVIIISAVTVFAGNKEESFFDSLETCTKYSGSGQTNTDGMDIKFTDQILGWENDKCVYKEKVNMSGVNSLTVCKFTKPQLNELTKVMRAYSTVQKYSGENIDLSSLNAVQNNPVVRVWNKYLQDPTTCSVSVGN